jgi:hypothetical protein
VKTQINIRRLKSASRQDSFGGTAAGAGSSAGRETSVIPSLQLERGNQLA